jgi:hypothetical protein
LSPKPLAVGVEEEYPIPLGIEQPRRVLEQAATGAKHLESG